MNTGDYLISAVREAGAGHVFGIQGDYVLKFYEMLYNSSIKLVNTTDEASAGFAADAYARVRGFGAVCVTYGVGGLNLVNSIAQAYAELSPVLVISGSPGISERSADASLHHKVHDFDFQLKIFREITVAQAVLNDPESAADEIDRVIREVLKHKRPGYIELPRDMVTVETAAPHKKFSDKDVNDRDALEEGLKETLEMLAGAEKPLISVGIEIHRYNLQEEVLALLEKTGMPFFTGILGKSVLSEKHPQFIGVYTGGMSKDYVRNTVHNSDCLLLLGPMITDFSTGMFTINIDASRCIIVNEGMLGISHHVYKSISMKAFIERLTATWDKPKIDMKIPARTGIKKFRPEKGRKITVSRFFECIDGFIADDDIVVAEAGDTMFGSLDLCIHGSTEFIAPAFYASLGFSVPASLGVQLASPGRRAVVLTGDGGFQFNAMMLSVSAKLGLNPIVVILNNNGYGLFRPMIDGKFNDIPDWNYAEIPRVIGAGKGYKVTTENELVTALDKARKNEYSPTIIDVRIERYDSSDATKRLLESLKKRI
ncbi:MAG TPA: thiamine pyrophosphate-binding protein [Desulfomonilia bacterium]